ncbi:Retrotransposon Gag-like protein 6 [Anabarilius grahami]|uniref:Retrotransposon Gag-like protein 6 n=1 Tax=Anabarilius grahami TaxID=495550 RepID=A0A3N0YD60_ANAGA|nr:Retrotransposon Gag-like protein 6 [Anabarilius grahami]
MGHHTWPHVTSLSLSHHTHHRQLQLPPSLPHPPSPLLPVYTSPMAKPAPYSGSAEDCNGFLLQVSLTLEIQPHLFPTDYSKVAFIISQLSGRALQWADSIWSQKNSVTQTYSGFVEHFREVFGKPSWDSSIGEKLYNLKQGKLTNMLCSSELSLPGADGTNKRCSRHTVKEWILECGCISLHTRIPSGLNASFSYQYASPLECIRVSKSTRVRVFTTPSSAGQNPSAPQNQPKNPCK